MKKILLMILILLSFGSAALAAGGKATLSWDANKEADLAGYKVYFGTASGKYGPAIDAGKTATPSTPSYSVTIPNDGTYYFAITAYDTAGNESGFSAEVSKIIDSTPPAPPSNLRAVIEKLIAFLQSLLEATGG